MCVSAYVNEDKNAVTINRRDFIIQKVEAIGMARSAGAEYCATIKFIC
jgi:hypothetical protein